MTKKKPQATKAKGEEWNDFKLQTFCKVRETVSGVKKQPTPWGNVKHTFARG